MTRPRDNPWLPFGLNGEGLRLFCLPFAGGGASSFVGWRRSLPGITVAPLQYPGRETRIDEPCPTVLDRLIDDIATALAAHLDRPYAVLGYSLGAKLAFALCHHLQARGLPPPRALFVIAHRPPDAPPPRPGAVHLPADDFRAHIKSYGGTPDEVFDSPELAELLLPILRADFALVEQDIPQTPISIPVYAYAGIDDAIATPTLMERWRFFTRSTFSMRSFAGGHFFARSAKDFLASLAQDLETCQGARPFAGPSHA
jgi:surfactin synthase thioesterase subunit